MVYVTCDPEHAQAVTGTRITYSLGNAEGRFPTWLGKKCKVLPYSLPSVGPGADPGVPAVSPQVT